MFLKNVPPVVAKHTEWRSFGTQPTCFTDSESDIHNSGSSVSGKVQMIIDSLRSSQSSVDMNSDCEALGTAGLFRERGRSTPETEYIKAKDQHSDCMKKESQSQSLDSDDSLDREIEEAIQEFLKKKRKKKGNKKEKPVQRWVTSQLSRDHQKWNPKKNPNNNINTVINKACTEKLTQSLLGKKDADIPLLFVSDTGTAAVLKHHSSLETKKDPKNLATDSHQTNDFSDSTSDDGIEEEIQRYLLEKQNEKSKKSKSQQSQKQSDSRTDTIENTNHQCKTNKQKNNKKSAKAPKSPKSKHTRVSIIQKNTSDNCPISKTTKNKVGGLKIDNSQAVICQNSGTGLSSCDFKGNSHSLTHSEVPAQSLSSLKVSTTAELMCTDILDISNIKNTESFTATAVPTSPIFSEDPTEDCDSPSGKHLVDNENIAQEATEFLELKQQVQTLSPERTNTQTSINKVGDNTELLQEKKKEVSHNKKVRLSLSWKRKLKEDLKIFKGSQLESLAFCVQNSNSLSSTSNMSAEACTDLHLTLTEKVEPVKTTNDSNSHQNREDAQRCKSLEEPDILIKPILKSKEFQATRCSKRTQKKASSDRNSSSDSDGMLDLPMKNLLETGKMVQIKTREKNKSKSVRFGAVQLIVPISEETILIEPKTRPIQVPIKNCLSKSYNVTMKHSPINNKKLNSTLNKSTAEQLMSVEMAKPSSQIKASVKPAQTGIAKLSHGNNQCAVPKWEEISSLHSCGSDKQKNRKFLAKKVKVSEVEAGEVDRSYKITSSGSVRAWETKMKCQQTEFQATTEVHILDGVKAAVLQRTPSVVPIPISNVSLSSPRLKGAEVKEQENTTCSEKWTPLVTGKKIKKRRLVDHINLGNHNTNIVPTTEDVLFQSQGPVMLNENSAASTRVGEVGHAYISKQPSIIHCHLDGSNVPAKHVGCTKFPTAEVNLCHTNATNTHQGYAEPHSDASLPCPTQTPSFMHAKMRKGSQDLLSHFALAENKVHIQKDKSVNVEDSAYRNSHIQIRKVDQNLAENTRDHKGKGQEIKVDEGDLCTGEEAEYVDETDYDSDGRGSSSQSSQEKKKPRTLFLSTSIDPGVKIRPYIILDTPQRYQKYMKCRKLMFTQYQKTSEMIPVLRQNAKSEEQKNCSNMSVNVKTFYAKTPTRKVQVFP